MNGPAGDRVSSRLVQRTYGFAAPSGGMSLSVTMHGGGMTTAAQRCDHATRTAVTFVSRDGTRLAGTLYLPIAAKAPLPGAVVIRSSGGQDRNEYASIIALLADELAAAGRAVLTYDKRGVGASTATGRERISVTWRMMRAPGWTFCDRART